MTKTLPYIAILLLLFVLFYISKSNTEERVDTVVTESATDTIIVMRVDTFRDTVTRFVSEKIVDTITIEKDSDKDLKLPIIQKYYRTDLYEAWISGYKPHLDSIYTYNKVVNRNVINTVKTEVYPKSTDLYVNGGLLYINNEVAPYIGASVKTQSDWLLGGSLGYNRDGFFYGLNVGLKIK